MRNENQRETALPQELKSVESRADTGVIGNATILQWNVEINPNQRTLPPIN